MTKKFWQLSPAERRVLLVDQGILTQAQADFWSTQTTLPETVLLGLSENNIGQMSLPVGVVPNVQIAGKAVTIPLATEEPSVVAAISHGFKMMSQGRTIQVVKNIHGVTGQIGLKHVSARDLTILQDHQADLQRIGLAAHPTLTSHDGAIRQIQIKRVGQSDAAIIVTVDSGNAMGANIMNDILEAMARTVTQLTNAEVLFAVLTNDGRDSLTQLTVTVAFDQLTTKTWSGEQVAQRIQALAEWAQTDPRRAVTHNKGIMNGVEAIVLATGNDTRAVNAAAHAYAAVSGQYRGLSRWHVETDGLHGEMTLPLPVGTVGGATKVLPSAQQALALLHQPSAVQLQAIAASVGLAANLAALHALVTDGIQRGHMRLQYDSLAVRVGATAAEIAPLAAALAAADKPSETLAQQLLSQLRHKGEN
jgi:hydroxymethylglutaryl-CoA reductase